MKLVVATGNAGKLKEITALLADHNDDHTGGHKIEIVGLNDFPDHPEIIEDGETFEANALKKARIIAKYTNSLTLADDSGLSVDTLNGEPGVYSARYAGPEATDSDNNEKLLTVLSETPQEQRTAAFHCAMALVSPTGEETTFHGSVQGEIIEKQQGDGGFGYDPLFYLAEYNKTFAELPMEIKNQISHRGNALKQVVSHLRSLK